MVSPKYFLLGLAVLIFNSAFASGTCGRVDRAKGQVSVLRIDLASTHGDELVRKARSLKRRDRLQCDDIVVTGRSSRAKIRYGKTAAISLGPLSRLEIGKFKKDARERSSLTLAYGKLRALIRKDRPSEKLPKKGDSRNAPASFKINTPSAVAGVRGTDFFVSYDPNISVMEQATLEGSVEVQQKVSGQSVLVSTGKQLTVKKLVGSTSQSGGGSKGSGGKDSQLGDTSRARGKPRMFEKLTPVPISAEVKTKIRQTSAIVKNDSEFHSKEALEILGAPESWPSPKGEL